ncbi:TIGR02450 family Trp-rich protein [Pseudoalteromonas sp. NZS11]|uniref:TIGR02450 family Trp-rich protein n=1 Tax=Pseudoalteromonas sp. NZS11 TaxID=2792049 RepID=UPI0018CCBB3B|nr:TIGR02450 family Trp-rich protein [Pseudoalteromonas sp. NZS11]MBH0080264.1 TIGR02450 family Trp-rich protein [Pseudoalteromonas sp. NZS11]
MNKLNPKKLLNSKWTATPSINKEKHFIIVEVEFDEDGNVIECITEAVMSKNQYLISWRDLKDNQKWLQGWK